MTCFPFHRLPKAGRFRSRAELRLTSSDVARAEIDV